jgi:hypothetical protein
MTMFDGSTGGAHAAAPAPYSGSTGYDNDFPPPAAPPLPQPTFDAFEALREQVAERDEEFERTAAVEIPGLGWRLICAIDFTYVQYKEWQKAALPRNQRNGRKVNVLDMDQAALAYFVLFNTCEGIEYQQSSGAWETLMEDGRPATLQSGTLMTKMKVMDPRLLVNRLFGGDARLIRAGNEVITAAGYGEQDDAGDEVDPTH